MVPSAGIASAAAEKALVVQALESHAEIIPGAVHGVLQVLDVPFLGGVALGAEKVQPAHARMPVAGKEKVAVGTESGEHLVSRGVDDRSQIFHGSQSVFAQSDAPDIQSAHSAGHITYEIEPHPVWRHGWVGIA